MNIMKSTVYLTILVCLTLSCNRQAKQRQENMALQHQLDSMKIESMKGEQKKEEEKVVVVHERNATHGTVTTTTQAQQPQKKKGISNTAKGALIGAGVGAVTGAAVSKEKGKGAIIGGLIGAGAGAVTGRAIDKKKAKDTAR